MDSYRRRGCFPGVGRSCPGKSGIVNKPARDRESDGADRSQKRMLYRSKVFLSCILAAIGYGVIHDEITAHLCVEYFSVAHPPLFPTSSPFLLAICWGIAATIGLGAVFGGLFAVVADAGSLPPIPLERVWHKLFALLLVKAVSAFVSGVIGYLLTRQSFITLPGELRRVIPTGHQNRFIGVWFAHLASYAVGLTGSGWVIFQVWRERGRPAVIGIWPRTRKEPCARSSWRSSSSWLCGGACAAINTPRTRRDGIV